MYNLHGSDVPFALVMAALEAIPVLSGANDTGFAWSIFTGDVGSHDPNNQLSRLEFVYYNAAVLILAAGII
jgi:sphingomyelin phosphodiesterase